MNKRDLVLDTLSDKKSQNYIPAGFFIHFDKTFHYGSKAVDKHIEFFNYTDMDILKVQFEIDFPVFENIVQPIDWKKLPIFYDDLFSNQIDIVKNLVKKMKKKALVIMTLYSPFMCTRSVTSEKLVNQHIIDSCEDYKVGIEKMTESLIYFASQCIKNGIDGFYASTQGYENTRFKDKYFFEKCIKPYDLTLMNEIDRNCIFNILHICDFRGPYNDLGIFLDYPGHVISCPLELNQKKVSSKSIAEFFQRPFMGGLDRKGVISKGSFEEIEKNVLNVLSNAPKNFILGADCTLPNCISWENIRKAIDIAHNYN